MGKAKQSAKKKKVFDEKGTDGAGGKIQSLETLWKEAVGTTEPTTTASVDAPTPVVPVTVPATTSSGEGEKKKSFGTPDGWYGIGGTSRPLG